MVVDGGSAALSFADFHSAIQSPRLRKVAQHWNTARGGRPMPGWNDIRPSQIAGELANIWVYKYDRQSGLFTGRLAGHFIEQVFGKSFRGTPMTEIYPPAEYPRLYERSRRVVCEPAFFRGEGMVFSHVERIGQGERIMLPLAEDGEHADGILGATIYEAFAGQMAQAEEAETWFSL